jgi:protein SCO1/2
VRTSTPHTLVIAILTATFLWFAAPEVSRAAAAPVAFKLAPWPQAAHPPSFRLRDADGAARTLQDYRGKVVVVFFGFLRCPGICSAEMHKLAVAMKQLGKRAAQVQVLFITLDPRHDSPMLLKSYLRAFDPRFIGLTGTTAQINQTTSSFQVQYTRVPQGTDYTIAHSTATLIIDASGQLRLVSAAESPVADLVHDLAILLGEGPCAPKAN